MGKDGGDRTAHLLPQKDIELDETGLQCCLATAHLLLQLRLTKGKAPCWKQGAANASNSGGGGLRREAAFSPDSIHLQCSLGLELREARARRRVRLLHLPFQLLDACRVPAEMACNGMGSLSAKLSGVSTEW